jgi:membrane complex biogenesis BtpA family protein
VTRFGQVFAHARPLIGVVHLPPLPGHDGSPGMTALVDHALADLAVIEACGLDGVLVENEHDRPHRILAGRETVAAMTAVTRELVRAAQVPVGAEILLNDPEASLAVALAGGAAFVRTDYFVDPMERPEHGPMRIAPDAVMRYRRRIGAAHVLLLADIQVKYARMLEQRSLAESARLAREHGADAIVVSGLRTGSPPSPEELLEAGRGAGAVPVLVGSGLEPANAAPLLSACGGAIVGTSLHRDGRADATRTKELARARPD